MLVEWRGGSTNNGGSKYIRCFLLVGYDVVEIIEFIAKSQANHAKISMRLSLVTADSLVTNDAEIEMVEI